MRRTKQITGILLSLMLLTGLFWPVRVHAAGTVTISVSSSTLNVGDQVTVTAWAAGPDGEKAIAKLGFNYDSGKLSFVSCSESSYSGGEGGYVGVSANTASITLKATAAGVAAVTVSGSNGVNVSDGTVEYGELTAGGTKLTVNNGTGAGNGQQNSNGTADDPADGTKSEDNSLASLKISPGTLSPAFQYSETNYTAAVGEDVTSISVDAKPSNEKATIESITGHTDLKPGQNTISITVKAENGTTATYKIVVTRGGAGETQTDNPEGETENPTPENTTENPQGITLNGHSFNLAASIPEDVIPQDFTKTTTTCNGQQAEGLLFDKAPLMLVYLTTPSTEVKNTLAVFEEASGAVYPFRKVEMGENYLILLNPPAEPGLSAEYTQAAGTLAGYENVPVFVNAAAAPAAAAPAENPEGEAAVPEGETAAPVQELPEFSLVYAASSHGNVGWYQYDAAENSFQRHVQAAAAPETPQESESGTDSVELQGLQSAYKDLEEQFNEKKESATRNTAIMVFVIAVLLVVSLGANIAWTTVNQHSQMEDELRVQGRALAQQMDAVWEFMVFNQDRLSQIAYTEDGVYQGLHCAIAGRIIGQSFTRQSDYTTRFVNLNPRNDAGMPDEYETAALNAFRADEGLQDVYGFAEVDGKQVFRYLAPMTIEEACLQCHGEPVGELDITGYPKEGWEMGDIGGAISIIMPLDVYQQNERDSIIQDVLFFAVMLAVCLVVVYGALSYLVTRPLGKIKAGVAEVSEGNLGVQLSYSESSQEMSDLTCEFNGMARELADVYANLEDEVADRTAQLQEANAVLERQRCQLEEVNAQLVDENQYKSDFLSMVSHELRTPLTSIVAFADLLNKHIVPSNEKEARALRGIEANSQALMLMINDILEMSRLDAGRVRLNAEVVDVGDIIALVRATVEPLALKESLEFSCHVAPDVPLIRADFDKLVHVLQNLCGNAVKFTPDGGHVSVEASYDQTADAVQFMVADTGIGIAPNDHERIFEKFAQVDSSSTRRYNGTGLGLAIVREYVDMHGGSVSVESALGQGAAFVVRIPVTPPEKDETDFSGDRADSAREEGEHGAGQAD